MVETEGSTATLWVGVGQEDRGVRRMCDRGGPPDQKKPVRCALSCLAPPHARTHACAHARARLQLGRAEHAHMQRVCGIATFKCL
eukprot:3366859-Pleurochrysis_carterae.AAC.1